VTFLLAGLLLALGPAQAAPAAGAPAAATVDGASALAAAVLPTETLVAARLPRFEAMFAEEIAADGELAAIEKEHPGVKQAVTQAARDEARGAYARAADLLRADVAQLYRSRFTPAEIATISRFFNTPTGKALVALSAGSSGDTASQFEADRQRRLLATLQQPDDQAKADLGALAATGLLPKMQAVRPEVSAISARRFDDVDTILSTTLPARIAATIKTFTETKERN
jgi:hypothetical protein